MIRNRTTWIWVLPLLLVVSITWNCGVKTRPVQPPVNVDKLLNRAWSAYDALDLDLALARFDSVLSLDATRAEAYLGKGMIMGLNGDFNRAHQFLNLAVFAVGQSGDLFIPSDTVPISPNAFVDGNYVVALPPERTPLIFPVSGVYVLEFLYRFVEQDTSSGQLDTVIGTFPQFQSLTITAFTNDSIFFTPPDTTVPSDTASWPIPTVAPDSGYVFVDTIPSANRFLALAYYYLRPGIQYDSDVPILAYGANAGAYLAEENYEGALRSAREAVFLQDSFAFTHYPEFTRNHILWIEAYASYQLGFLAHSVEVLSLLDPSWTPPEDPYSPEAHVAILQELEALETLWGGIF